MTTKDDFEDTNYTPCEECGAHLITRNACETCLDTDLDDAYQAGVRQGRNMLLADLAKDAEGEALARLEALGPITYAHCVRCGDLSDGNRHCLGCRPALVLAPPHGAVYCWPYEVHPVSVSEAWPC